MGILASLYLTYVALALLALAYVKHHRQAFGAAPSGARARRLRVLGGAVLVLSPLPWTLESGFAFAMTTWLWCALPCVGVLLVAMLAFRPALAARLALIGRP